ncbi:restriction endonuclease subunit S [Flavobacterium algoritolerans]|uniref:Restriction endonuclease subunit S n=1 Tax=Flavobacterium algoritolerans TaxID=3041254 RepID=A0ABT6VBX8_9FLAO|nr:restriction endonuclease subunit S [Flavobacterium algoritolerans]MDI5895748.1 restriction endonuclease subunit S [Flavobacterium algoritolerans]
MKTVKILETVKIINDTVKKFDGIRCFLSTGDLDLTEIKSLEDVTYLGKPSRANQNVKKDDIILARMQGTVKVKIIDSDEENIIVSTGFMVLRCNKDIDNRFIFHYLKSNLFQSKKDKLCSGATQKAINNNKFAEIQIPLPNLPTQQKIAAILDKADELRQYNKQLITKYDALTQSLFLEMFGDPVRNEKGFPLKQLKEFGSSRLGKMLDGKKIIGNNLKPYLRNSNVQWFRFQLDDLLQMDFDEKDKIEFSLLFGDILMCEGGEIGRCAIWKDETADCYFQKAIHRIRLNDKYVLPEYFVYMFKKISDNGGLNEFKSAATISHLTGEKLKKMRLPIPPIKLQNQFAERVQMIETQKQQAQEALAKSENLFQGLLQRAFKGELN